MNASLGSSISRLSGRSVLSAVVTFLSLPSDTCHSLILPPSSLSVCAMLLLIAGAMPSTGIPPSAAQNSPSPSCALGPIWCFPRKDAPGETGLGGSARRVGLGARDAADGGFGCWRWKTATGPIESLCTRSSLRLWATSAPRARSAMLDSTPRNRKTFSPRSSTKTSPALIDDATGSTWLTRQLLDPL
eukprot:1565846-Prymnesium_polylepis.1